MLLLKKKISFFLFILFFLSLQLPNFVPMAQVVDLQRAPIQNSPSIAFSVAVEIVLFSIVGRAGLFFFVQILFFLWLPFELIYIFRYGAPTSAHILAILYESNLNEIIGYIGGMASIFSYIIYVIIIILTIRYVSLQNIVWVHRSRKWVLAVAGFLLISAVGFEKVQERNLNTLNIVDDGFVTPQMGYGLSEYMDTYPWGLILRLTEFFQQQKMLVKTSEGLKSWNSKYTRKITNRAETYVVIIGETSRADHWSLNGYQRETNPLLSARKDIINFSNAISVTSATRTAVPILLSRTTVRDVYNTQLKNSWITDFKKQGFKVYWLSTQMPVGTHDTMIGAYSNLADVTKFLNMGRYSIHNDFDEVLQPAFSTALNEPNEKKLIILHTLGSHAPYQYRYPNAFEKFKPAPAADHVVSIFNKEESTILRNAYDNTILYTDYLINNIINILDSKNIHSALWYTSDHGETFVDENCSSAGHGFGSKYNFHVPLIFWASKNFTQSNSVLMLSATQNKDSPIYSKDFFDTLMVTAGFEDPEGRFNSYLSPDYRPGKRMVATSSTAMVDYDIEYASNICGEK